MREKGPLVLTLCNDLFFLPRIEDGARALGYRFKAISHKKELGIEEVGIKREVHLTEPLEGPDATFLHSLVAERPALIIIDTASENLPWRNWIHIIKTSAATRRIPILAFGSHVNKDPLLDASAAGADITVSRGRLQASLAELINEWASSPDDAAIQEACLQSLTDDAKHGIRLIAEGEYYQAHEILETAWENAIGAEKYLLRSLLQVSVAYLHIQRGNLRGAMKMLLRLSQWISPLPSECQGIDVNALRENLVELRTTLENTDLSGDGKGLHRFLMPIPWDEQ
jgi:predicted metal-dependent hydrolase